ncbi:efflux RND transporter periplasmic adaptor subunit [Methylobacterium brachiatum]|jgi:cobalt-zinc-cadmium efflux system membrane fusion protein|uniref:Cobalt-zinc-cadmium efflux system membrane fusion protein n=1 Tax=Methylobacterium brachiatum TaxID=269660 RepID=A0AAJ1U118_9HYPH|nr:efflux RND transporter periplasmic adaptor subunit [Methylobacterium brachiatum]AYO86635.1 efflux RND transporter periplasmic adaptor subunit [Methylobacterium brachiatum]MCB4806409.1 efflux RND transporter periplasmic adaptor subunit [Methylobacterium brachiatum]MDQ0547427.1 cobalt-zinc-cadmium efflux system membrane fusion protein [Methylobacterium brachiatum]
MRILLSVAILATGIAIGGAVPPVSEFIQGALATVGISKLLPPPAASDGASKAEAPEHTAEPGSQHVEKAGVERPANGPEHKGGEKHAEESVIKMQPEQAARQDITLAQVEGGTLARHLTVPGTITPDADRIARVPARVVGTVAEMRKRLGDFVRKGEVVAVLDSREVADAKSEYLTTTVKAELEKTNFDRQQALWDKRISAESAFLNARAVYTEAQLRVDLARQKLSALGLNAGEVATSAKKDETTPNLSSLRQYELRSPLTGRVVERKVDVGTTVGGQGDPADLYAVADLSSVWIELAVPTTELAKVKEGARVVVVPSQSDEDKRAEGKIVFVSPILNPDTRSARVIVALPNKDMTWRPGTFVTAEVEIAQDEVAVRVPKAALQTIDGKRVAFVRTPEGFEKRNVEVGRTDDEAVEIVSGLSPGEEIAVGNTFLLKAELGKSASGDND